MTALLTVNGNCSSSPTYGTDISYLFDKDKIKIKSSDKTGYSKCLRCNTCMSLFDQTFLQVLYFNIQRQVTNDKYITTSITTNFVYRVNYKVTWKVNLQNRFGYYCKGHS